MLSPIKKLRIHSVTMNTFRKLKIIRTYIGRIPKLNSMQDFDIVLELGFAQRSGQPLTLKRLMLLNLASSATLRRHLNRLVTNGTVIKKAAASDHRNIELTISDETIETLEHCLEKIHGTLCDVPGAHP